MFYNFRKRAPPPPPAEGGAGADRDAEIREVLCSVDDAESASKDVIAFLGIDGVPGCARLSPYFIYL
ncbi:hypothetical protein EVAR_81037_1 [Eumeta japonica]|uniref:Uncharacterized protein n=1 Tax=Eumeta variegata TaxID=151549 RepID=A0A4C1T8E0_EUMVA|nr:hypothetical protein EVAR_81037_1 [Eumeta japonica]